jgi:hypothetical protein
MWLYKRGHTWWIDVTTPAGEHPRRWPIAIPAECAFTGAPGSARTGHLSKNKGVRDTHHER